MRDPTLHLLHHLTTATPLDTEVLQQGLQTHLAHTELVTVLMRVAQDARAYVMTEGCDGCAHHRHRLGCYGELFGRMLAQATGRMDVLAPVRLGLAARPYTTRVLAWPTQTAQPLESTLLAPWPEARLVVHWKRPLVGKGIGVAALVLVGDTEPPADPVVALTERGWKALRLPPKLPWLTATRGLPPTLPLALAAPFAPYLLLPPARTEWRMQHGECSMSASAPPPAEMGPLPAVAPGPHNGTGALPETDPVRLTSVSPVPPVNAEHTHPLSQADDLTPPVGDVPPATPSERLPDDEPDPALALDLNPAAALVAGDAASLWESDDAEPPIGDRGSGIGDQGSGIGDEGMENGQWTMEEPAAPPEAHSASSILHSPLEDPHPQVAAGFDDDDDDEEED